MDPKFAFDGTMRFKLSRGNQIEEPIFHETSNARRRRVTSIDHNAVVFPSLPDQCRAGELLENHGYRRTHESVAATVDQ